jgi:hypothetical protein
MKTGALPTLKIGTCALFVGRSGTMNKFFQKIIDYFMSCEKCDRQNSKECPLAKFKRDPIMGEIIGFETKAEHDFFCKNFERR